MSFSSAASAETRLLLTEPVSGTGNSWAGFFERGFGF